MSLLAESRRGPEKVLMGRAVTRARRKPGGMADVNARRVYPIGGPQAVRLCVCGRRIVRSLPCPELSPLVMMARPSFVPCWQGFWILIRLKGHGWLRLLGGPVQRLSFLGRGESVVCSPSPVRRVRKKTLTPIGWSDGGPGPGLGPSWPSIFSWVFVIVLFFHGVARAGE